ncbi:MAG: DUF5684 domain-containing protein [Candidatus Shapirobacteria bacterium]|jgi:hypothetical protein
MNNYIYNTSGYHAGYGYAAGIGGMGMFGNFICFLFLILMLASAWKIFVKAGKPGWAALVPVYNMVVLLEIVGMPIWYIFLMFIPLVNIIIGLVVLLNLVKSFKKSMGFVLGLIFLPMIFYPILAFGKSRYTKIRN